MREVEGWRVRLLPMLNLTELKIKLQTYTFEQVNQGEYAHLARAPPAHALLLLESWFNSFEVGRAFVVAVWV